MMPSTGDDHPTPEATRQSAQNESTTSKSGGIDESAGSPGEEIVPPPPLSTRSSPENVQDGSDSYNRDEIDEGANMSREKIVDSPKSSGIDESADIPGEEIVPPPALSTRTSLGNFQDGRDTRKYNEIDEGADMLRKKIVDGEVPREFQQLDVKNEEQKNLEGKAAVQEKVEIEGCEEEEKLSVQPAWRTRLLEKGKLTST